MKKNLVKTFSTVFIITIISKVLGLLRDIIFAKYYGTGTDSTAYFAAIKIPTQIVDIVLSSALVSTFIPVFNSILKKDGDEKAGKFASNFISIIAAVATFIAVIGMIFAPWIVKLMAGGFDDETYNLTVQLVRITFPMIIFTALAYSFVGILQSYGKFNIPAAISGISNIVVILFLILFNEKFGVNGLCYCIVFAWLLQLLVQLPTAKKIGYKFKFGIDFKDENIKRTFKNALPILLSTAVLPINNLVSAAFASHMSDEGYSALEYAYKLYIVIYGVFTYAVGNIIFPELSRSSDEADSKEFTEIIHKALKLVSFILIPLTAGVIIYSKDIVSILYEGGEFTANSTMNTGLALGYYSIGIIGAGIVEIMNKAFYAKEDTKTPLFVGIAAIALNAILCFALSSSNLGFAGLALATAVVALCNGGMLTLLINKKIKGIITKGILIYFAKALICTLLMCVVVLLINFALKDLDGNLLNIVRVGAGALVGVIVYFVSTLILKINEFKALFVKEKVD